jgi:hypothetical protein
MPSKNHRQGKKMGGKHTTVIDAALGVVDLALNMPEVSKVSVGHIKVGIRSGKHRIKVKEMIGGVILTVRGSTSVQEIRIYGSDISKIKKVFEEYVI